ncbi:MAG: outer membrane protein transport protein [Syntrophales bacterium]|nr:outer membrane protein transport protein [Syntrophales bacterium]
MRKHDSLLRASLIIFFLFQAAHVWGGTSTNSPIGWGGRSVGMGGTGVATSEDVAGMAYNPATLTEVERDRFDLGIGILWPRRSFSNDWNADVPSKKILYPVPQTGYVYKLPDSDASMGIGVFFTYGAGTEYKFRTPWFPDGAKNTHSTLGVIKLTPTIAYKVTPSLSVGATLDINYGMVKMGTPFGPAYLDVDKAEGWGYGFQVGLLYKYSDNLKFGLAYTSESNLEDLKADNAYLEISPLAPGGPAVWRYKKAIFVDLQQPSTLAFGIGYQATKKLLFALDVKWQNYSDVLNKLELKLSDGTGPDQTMAIPTDWSDAYVGTFGLEYRLTERFSARAGYNYDSNTVNSSRLLPIVPDTGAAHTLTLGLGYRWDNYEADFAFANNFKHGKRTDKSQFPIPASNGPGNEYDNSYLDYSCTYWVLTISKLF